MRSPESPLAVRGQGPRTSVVAERRSRSSAAAIVTSARPESRERLEEEDKASSRRSTGRAAATCCATSCCAESARIDEEEQLTNLGEKRRPRERETCELHERLGEGERGDEAVAARPVLTGCFCRKVVRRGQVSFDGQGGRGRGERAEARGTHLKTGELVKAPAPASAAAGPHAVRSATCRRARAPTSTARGGARRPRTWP